MVAALAFIAAVETTMRRKKITRAELARRLGVSRARVTLMFGKDQNWTVATMYDVCHALGVRLIIGVEDVV